MDSNLQSIAGLVNYIEDHLAEDLNLSRLASLTGYSKYHLHRMFTGIVGYPIHYYVQRRRLTEAARLLIFSNQPIIDISSFAGYDTQQNFTRAFKEQFQCSPAAFRKKQEFYPIQLRCDLKIRREVRGDMNLENKIVQAGKIILVGYKANTAQGFSVIGGCWAKLHQNKDAIPHQVNPDVLFVLDDYTADFDEGEQPAFDYYAAAEVSSLDNTPEGMVTRELPASKYVVFTYRAGPKDSMRPVADYVYKEWFPQSTARLNDKACYDFSKCEQKLDAQGKSKVEFWVPIL